MSKRKPMCFALLVSVVCLVIFTVVDIISSTLTPTSFLFSFINCVIFFIIIYFSFNKGYKEGFDYASTKKFDSYLHGFQDAYKILKNNGEIYIE